MAYSPRKRARSQTPHLHTLVPTDAEKPTLQGFAGYKVGMTHALMVDYRPTSTTSGQSIQTPVTVVETPPMKAQGMRCYRRGPQGLEVASEIWTGKEGGGNGEGKERELDPTVEEVRLLAQTSPHLVSGVPSKDPNLMELGVGGGTLVERIEYARSLLGKDVNVRDFAHEGDMVDVCAVTKGKGFQGAVQRWGVKRQSHKDSKGRRDAGNLGPWNPSFVRSTVPQAGQMGSHQRTEYNKRVLRISQALEGQKGKAGKEKGKGTEKKKEKEKEEINPVGGFPHYGLVRGDYILLHGTIPGPVKRLVRMRDAVRYRKGVRVERPDLVYVSTTSKQG